MAEMQAQTGAPARIGGAASRPLLRSAMSFHCTCGHRVHDEPHEGQDTMGYLAYALSDRHRFLVEDVAPAEIVAYFGARGRGEEQAWLSTFFTVEYARLGLDPATVVLDILSAVVQRVGAVQHLWQCEACYRLWVSDAREAWRHHGFSPDVATNELVFDVLIPNS